MPSLGQRLKQRRIEEGLSLRDLEKIVGVSFSSLARIERGVGTCIPDSAKRINQWLDTGQGSGVKESRKKHWFLSIQQRVDRIEKILGITDLPDA